MRLKIIFALATLLSLYTVSACGELYPFVDINDVTSVRLSENRIRLPYFLNLILIH